MPCRVLCAPASFKETLSARAAALAMEQGLAALRPWVETDRCAVADGGEGTLDALAEALHAEIRTARAMDPLGAPIACRFALSAAQSLGIVELAEASGLGRIAPHDRNPSRTTTYGTGELMRAALEHGCTRLIVGVGGSATVDGGAGLAQALGVEFLDASGRPIRQPMTGGLLSSVRSIRRIAPGAEIHVACDVTSPLCGPGGAAEVYGPQKGASALQVRQLGAALRHLASLAGADPDTPGAGAAGGAAYGLLALLGAELHPGIDLVLGAVRFAERCRAADLVLTGEGRLDRQTLQGKAILGVARAAAALRVPVIAIVGDAAPGAEACVNGERGLLTRYVSLTDRFGRGRALSEARALVAQMAQEIVRQELSLP